MMLMVFLVPCTMPAYYRPTYSRDAKKTVTLVWAIKSTTMKSIENIAQISFFVYVDWYFFFILDFKSILHKTQKCNSWM